MVNLINYRLHRPSQNYEGLYDAIKSLSGTYWHNTTSSWLVQTALSPKQVYDKIRPHIDGDDELVVFRLEGDYHGQLQPDDLKWLEGRTFY